MSFLNSVLKSINSGDGHIAAPQVLVTKRQSQGVGQQAAPLNAKRKASEDISPSNGKAQKATAPSSSRPIIAASRPLASTKTSSVSTSTLRKPDQPKLADTSGSKAPPKKGSFKEILARAKQNTALQVGQLTHKPKEREKLSTKKELLLQKEQAKAARTGKYTTSAKGSALQGKMPLSQGRTSLPPGKSRPGLPSRQNSEIRDGKRGLPSKHEENGTSKQRPQSSYQGTARPKAPQPAYRGTMKPSTDTRDTRGYQSDPGRGQPKTAQRERRDYRRYDSEEEGESDDGYDYASEDYSDMDAGFDDVDEEEEAAERAARKEDLHEQMMLAELARQKAERKKRAQLAAEREKAHRR